MLLLAAGSNAKGQLGIGSHDDAHTFIPCQFAGCEPNQLPDLTSTVAHIACGANHTVLLLEQPNGTTTLWGTGDGWRGQLGPGHTDRREQPWTTFRKLVVPVVASYAAQGYTCTHIAAAWETTYLVLTHPDGSDVLLSMGSDDFGALGVGEGGDGSPRVEAVDFGHVFPDGDAPRPRMRIRSLHAGPRHVVAQLVLTDMCAEGPSSHPHPLAVLVGWGACRHGQLGQNGGARCVVRPMRLPIDVQSDPAVACGLGNQHTVVLHASGRLSTLGSNKQGQISSVGSQRCVGRVGCTWNGTYMLTVEGVLRSMGNNAQGQLGRGNSVGSAADATVELPGELSTFVCGSEHVLVVMPGASQEENMVLGWGWNEHGNMGLGSLVNVPLPRQLWPNEHVETYAKYSQTVLGIWAGCATSWLLVG